MSWLDFFFKVVLPTVVAVGFFLYLLMAVNNRMGYDNVMTYMRKTPGEFVSLSFRKKGSRGIDYQALGKPYKEIEGKCSIEVIFKDNDDNTYYLCHLFGRSFDAPNVSQRQFVEEHWIPLAREAVADYMRKVVDVRETDLRLISYLHTEFLPLANVSFHAVHEKINTGLSFNYFRQKVIATA